MPQQRKPFTGQWKGRKRPPNKALNEQEQAGSYTFDASALRRAVCDSAPIERYGATATGYAIHVPGASLPGRRVVGRT